MMIVRKSPVHRISEHCDQLDGGKSAGDPLRGVGMEKVIRAGLSGDDVASMPTFAVIQIPGGCKVGPVPVYATGEMVVEKVNLLVQGGRDVGVLPQVVIERTRAGLLCPYNDEIWEQAIARGCPANLPSQREEGLPEYALEQLPAASDIRCSSHVYPHLRRSGKHVTCPFEVCAEIDNWQNSTTGRASTEKTAPKARLATTSVLHGAPQLHMACAAPIYSYTPSYGQVGVRLSQSEQPT